MIRFFADENIARAVVVWLRGKGYDVLYAADSRPGTADTDWLREAQDEGRIILTSDRDFGDLIFRDHRTSHGVILLRLEGMAMADRLSRLQEEFNKHEEDFEGNFVVIDANRVRIRNLNQP